MREDDSRFDLETISRQVAEVLAHIRRAHRPVIFAGSGIRIGSALGDFERVIRSLRIPVVTAWTHDLIASDDELFCGRPGTIGERAGNFTVQNSDVLLVLGSRLNIRQVSYNWTSFARFATKIQVDIDEAELKKPLVKPDIPIHCDLKLFLAEMATQLGCAQATNSSHKEVVVPRLSMEGALPCCAAQATGDWATTECVRFYRSIVHRMTSDRMILLVCGNATACIVPFQTAQLKTRTTADFEFGRGVHGL